MLNLIRKKKDKEAAAREEAERLLAEKQGEKLTIRATFLQSIMHK